MVKKISVIDVAANEDDKLDTAEEIAIEDEAEEVDVVSFTNPTIDNNTNKQELSI